jgi:hypothetical protein
LLKGEKRKGSGKHCRGIVKELLKEERGGKKGEILSRKGYSKG